MLAAGQVYYPLVVSWEAGVEEEQAESVFYQTWLEEVEVPPLDQGVLFREGEKGWNYLC